MILFRISDFYKRFTDPLGESSDVELGRSEIERFSNHELHVRVATKVDGMDCLIVGSLAPPDKQLMSLCMLADALKHAGARAVFAFLPYLGYGRQDKFQPGESRGIQLLGSWIAASGIDKTVTVDTHSELEKEFFSPPLISLSPADIFAGEIRQLGWEKFTVVAPDEGAMCRAKDLSDALSQNMPPAHFVKKRANEVVHLELIGEVGSRAVIVDDILDTGKTLVSACKELRSRGVEEIAVAVTHGLFTDHDWKRIFEHGVTSCMVGDSTPEAVEESEYSVHVKLIPLAPLMPAVIESLRGKE